LIEGTAPAATEITRTKNNFDKAPRKKKKKRTSTRYTTLLSRKSGSNANQRKSSQRVQPCISTKAKILIESFGRSLLHLLPLT